MAASRYRGRSRHCGRRGWISERTIERIVDKKASVGSMRAAS
jgi:hypothetical protein